MPIRNAIKHMLYYVVGVGVVGLMAVGCAMQEPLAIRDIAQARNALETMHQNMIDSRKD